MDQNKGPPFLTAPNLITLTRLPLAALAWLRPLETAFVLALMALAAATDVLDGWLERRARARRGTPADPPGAGAWLDPLCDKVFVISVLASIASARGTPLWLVPLIAAREILQTAAALVWRIVPEVRTRLRFEFRAAVLGKAATIAQFCAIGAILVDHPDRELLAAATGAVGLTAGLFYVRRAWRAARP